MDFKCEDCGNIFDEGEAAIIKDYHDEVDDFERFMVCPCCGSGNIEEMVRCKSCQGEFLQKELYAGYCKECLQKRFTTEKSIAFMDSIGL